eukprot:6105206-Pyramimonas_sp.AAC.1
MHENKCQMSLEGVRWADWVSWDRSIRTGGVESPFLFKVVYVYMWEQVVRQWEDNDYGYELEPPLRGGRRRIARALLADNLYVCARSIDELRGMMSMLAVPFAHAGLRWKPSSLGYLLCGGWPR